MRRGGKIELCRQRKRDANEVCRLDVCRQMTVMFAGLYRSRAPTGVLTGN